MNIYWKKLITFLHSLSDEIVYEFLFLSHKMYVGLNNIAILFKLTIQL